MVASVIDAARKIAAKFDFYSTDRRKSLSAAASSVLLGKGSKLTHAAITNATQQIFQDPNNINNLTKLEIVNLLLQTLRQDTPPRPSAPVVVSPRPRPPAPTASRPPAAPPSLASLINGANKMHSIQDDEGRISKHVADNLIAAMTTLRPSALEYIQKYTIQESDEHSKELYECINDSFTDFYNNSGSSDIIPIFLPISGMINDKERNTKLVGFNDIERSMFNLVKSNDTKQVFWYPGFINIKNTKQVSKTNEIRCYYMKPHKQKKGIWSAYTNMKDWANLGLPDILKHLNCFEENSDSACFNIDKKSVLTQYIKLENPDTTVVVTRTDNPETDLTPDIITYNKMLSIIDTTHDFGFHVSSLNDFRSYLSKTISNTIPAYIRSKNKTNIGTILQHFFNESELKRIISGKKIENVFTAFCEETLDYMEFTKFGALDNSADNMYDIDKPLPHNINRHIIIKLGVKPKENPLRTATLIYRHNDKTISSSLNELFGKYFGANYTLVVDQGVTVNKSLLQNIQYTGAALFDGSISRDTPVIDKAVSLSDRDGQLFLLNNLTVRGKTLSMKCFGKDEPQVQMNESWNTKCRPNVGKERERVEEYRRRIEDKKCSAQVHAKVNENGNTNYYNYFMYDFKRAGDFLQVVSCKIRDNVTPVFITHDILAATHARMLKIPVVYTDKDRQGCRYLHMFTGNNSGSTYAHKEYRRRLSSIKSILNIAKDWSDNYKANYTTHIKSLENIKQIIYNIHSRSSLGTYMTNDVKPMDYSKVLFMMFASTVVQEYSKLNSSLNAYIKIEKQLGNYDTIDKYYTLPDPPNMINIQRITDFYKLFVKYINKSVDSKNEDQDLNIQLYKAGMFSSHLEQLDILTTALWQFIENCRNIQGDINILEFNDIAFSKEFNGMLKSIPSNNIIDVQEYLDAYDALNKIRSKSAFGSFIDMFLNILRRSHDDTMIDNITNMKKSDVARFLDDAKQLSIPKTDELIGYRTFVNHVLPSYVARFSGGGKPIRKKPERKLLGVRSRPPARERHPTATLDYTNNIYLYGKYLFEAEPRLIMSYSMFLAGLGSDVNRDIFWYFADQIIKPSTVISDSLVGYYNKQNCNISGRRSTYDDCVYYNNNSIEYTMLFSKIADFEYLQELLEEHNVQKRKLSASAATAARSRRTRPLTGSVER